MDDQSQTDALEWRNRDVPVSRRFDDPYFSLENGLAETRHTFLAGNDLPTRFVPGFHIAELGFGSGLNLLAAWAEWERAGIPGPLHYTGFEAWPMTPAQMERALTAFAELAHWRERFIGHWDATIHSVTTPVLQARVIIGDARQTLPGWDGRADAWFLDGFSPAKNPEIWEESLLMAVGMHTRPGGTCASYTAAGQVRRRLQAAGFTVTRTAGFGRKRHMTRGVRP
ncbi:MAG: tRNA (5-methylaminomethyl-2-thiouridine)(34)-methyltransferase MnmD [Rhodobacteraceae bacterium]|nr:tRNA (5-methylaminomethyl-2-thiouridine)(34)-methyltransferase MnmD [Paracoccaceae bacterium]